jgi:hypothetical protein
MKKTILTLLGLSSLLTACNFLHNSAGPSTPYQQCNGLKQQMFFINSNMDTNNNTPFQTQQQLQVLRNQFNAQGCTEILNGTAPAKPATPAPTKPAAKKPAPVKNPATQNS